MSQTPEVADASAPPPRLADNAAWRDAAPRLSVLVPFFRDDPRPLVAALDAQAQGHGGAVELVLLDDAGGDAALSDAVEHAVRALALPARLVRLGVNAGRAAARNTLAAHARAPHLLFVDADMLPERADFLARWLEVAATGAPAAFGGFTVSPERPPASYALHHALQAAGDCLSAEARAREPARTVASSNLLVRRGVLEAEPFDPGFQGWGWEDVDWAARVAARFGVAHPDIPARHLGLDTAAALAAKYEQSAPNYARLAARHPDLVRGFRSHRAARAIRRWSARTTLRSGLKAVALAEVAPLRLRVAAMRLYRAALYAEVV